MGQAATAKKKVPQDSTGADPFLLYSVPQTPTGAKKAGLHGDWEGFRHEHRADSIYWIYWLLFLVAIGFMASVLMKFAKLI